MSTNKDQFGLEDIVIPKKRNDGDTLEERMNENAWNNLMPARYIRYDADGNQLESHEEVFERVAKNVALADAVYLLEDYDGEFTVTPDQIKANHSKRNKLAEEVFGDGVTTDDTDVEGELTEHNVYNFSYDSIISELPDEIAEEVKATKQDFEYQMSHLDFMPNTPTIMNAGDELQQLSACFVLSPEDDMDDIHDKVKDAASIFKSGGGCGYGFWQLRPYGDKVGSSGGISSGPMTFMETFDQMCATVAQGGTRRGAQMGIMRISHPDSIFFIHAKNKDVSLAKTLLLNDPDDYTHNSFAEALEEARDLISTDADGNEVVPHHLRNAVEGNLSNFNISVGVTDAFMDAVENDEEYTFINPRTEEPHIATEETKEMYGWFGLGDYVEVGEPLEVPAREVWTRMIDGAHENGEPGVVFLERANNEHSFDVDEHPEYRIKATNPCVTGDTRVYTENGILTAKELYEAGTANTVTVAQTLSSDEVGKESSSVFKTGEKEVFTITTEDGYELRVTADHQIYTTDGEWVEAQDLSAGDTVQLLDREGLFGSHGTLEEGVLSGVLTATDDEDIDSVHYEVSLENITASAPFEVKQAFEGLNMACVDGEDETTISVSELADRLTEAEVSADMEAVPDEVYTGSREFVKGFLQSVFSIKGDIVNPSDDLPFVSLRSENKSELQDIQQLLLNFGITSKILQGQNHPEYHFLEIHGESVVEFEDSINFLGAYQSSSQNRYKRKRLSSVVEADEEELEEIETSYSATVEAIETDGVEEVFDLVEPDTHSFIANGVVVHNCVAEDTLVNTPDGYRHVQNIEVGDTISTVRGEETVDEIETHTDYPVYKVKFSDGGEQYVTAAHRYHAIKKGSSSKRVDDVRLDELEEGDYVRLHPTPTANTGTDMDYEEGVKKGILLGDGNYSESAVDNSSVSITTGGDEEILQERIRELFDIRDGEYSQTGSHRQYISDGGVAIQTAQLTQSLSPDKSFDIQSVDTVSEVIGIIDGLVATDGDINLSSTHPQVRITTTSKDLAQNIRNLGFLAGMNLRVNSNEIKDTEIDGREVSTDSTRYRVHLSGESLRTYLEYTNLYTLHETKGNRLREVQDTFMCTGNTWKAQIESIEEAGTADVYDLYCEDSDTWITEGYVQRGCGEQPLSEYEACNLGHINLSTLADTDAPDWRLWWSENQDDYDSMDEAMPDYMDLALDMEEFDNRIEIGTHFLENVVTMSDFPVEEITERVHEMRKIGLGVMGLAQLYIQLGLAYGSEPGNEFSRELMTYINHGSKEVSHELAQERGSFESWEDSKYANPTEYTEWFEKQTGEDAEDWVEGFPIRNHNTTTIAPTGSTSMLGNTTGGCEPIFNVAYYKNVSDDVQGDEMLVEFDDYFLRVLEANDIDVTAVKKEAARQMEANEFDGVASLDAVPTEIGELFVVTSELSGLEHASVQCALQDGVDSAISKTVNFPNSATKEEMQEVYEYVYQNGGKGVTVYRDGTRSKQVLTTRADNKDFADEEDLIEAVRQQAGDSTEFRNELAQVLMDTVQTEDLDVVEFEDFVAELAEDVGIASDNSDLALSEYRKRPDNLVGATVRVTTGYGTLYVVLNEDENGDLFEVFCEIGKSGGYTQAFTEAISRTVSMSLRYGVPPKRIIKHLEGIRSPKVGWDNGDQVDSIPDGIAVAMKRYLNHGGVLGLIQAQRNGDVEFADPDTEIPDSDSETGLEIPDSEVGESVGLNAPVDGNSDTGGAAPDEIPECPECSSMSLNYSEGCKTCESCGWSEC